MVSMHPCRANVIRMNYSQLCCDASLNFVFKVDNDVATESFHWFDLEKIRATFCTSDRMSVLA